MFLCLIIIESFFFFEKPVLIELERIERPILVISHQAITRVLLAFFQEIQPEKIPYTEV